MSARPEDFSVYLANMPISHPSPPFYVQKLFYPGWEKDYRRRVETELSESRERIDAYNEKLAEFKESLQQHFPIEKEKQ